MGRPLDDNEEQLRASTRKLLDLVERAHVALVIFGHDGEQWQTLKKAPAYYELYPKFSEALLTHCYR